MNIQDYIKAAVRTESHPDKLLQNLVSPGIHGDTEACWKSRLLHSVIGLCTETGELQEFFDSDKDNDNLKEEVGDLLWYCAISYDTLGVEPTVPLDEVVGFDISQLAVAVGNMQDVVKRSLFYGKEFDRERYVENLDIVFQFCDEVLKTYEDYGREEAMSANIAKLKARYPEKFTEENAVNRDLDKEREALKG